MDTIEKKILESLEVSDKSELCAYVYNHGNNPKFEIYKKADVRKVDCTKNEWMRQGGYRFGIIEGANAILNESGAHHAYCESINESFYRVMSYASQLDDANKYAQSIEVRVFAKGERMQ